MSVSPLAILIAGPPGIGKTACVARALGRRAHWTVTERGGLDVARNPAVNPSGEVPDYDECLTTVVPWREALTSVRAGVAGVRAGRYVAIVLDTLSTLADREMDHLQQTMATGHGREWAVLGAHLRAVVNEALAAEAIVVAICHYEAASDFHGARPRLPGRLGSELIPSLFSVVLRCELRAGSNGAPVRVFRLPPDDPLWKDRTGVVVDGEPMDLRSVLRRATQRLQGRVVDAAPASLLGEPIAAAHGAQPL